MLERISSPDSVLAFRAVGKIEKSDYDDILEPAIRDMVDARGEVRLVYVLDDAFEGYSISAGWEDAKLGIGHSSKWTRCAVVTDHDWIRHLTGMFGWMMPGDLKVFEPGQLEAAVTWASG